MDKKYIVGKNPKMNKVPNFVKMNAMQISLVGVSDADVSTKLSARSLNKAESGFISGRENSKGIRITKSPWPEPHQL
jgi:hypothetical protein